jgi:hypothetical protein
MTCWGVVGWRPEVSKTLIDFVATASKSLVECSINDFRGLREFESLGGLATVTRVREVCEQAGLVCNPPLDEGELDTLRIFRSVEGADDGPALFDSACQAGEGHLCEFKQTLGLNVKRLKQQPETPAADLFEEKIIHEVIKTIASFMNSDGGTLVIGLCDDGSPYGIQNEFQYVPGNQTQDGWFLRLGSALQSYLPDYRLVLGYMRQYVVVRDEAVYCVLSVQPRRDRLTVCKKHGSSDEIVYRRAGNSTLRLQASEIEALVMDRYRHK